MRPVLLISLVLITSVHAIIFHCTFSDQFNLIGIRYTCQGNAEISGDGETVSEVRGNHWPGRINFDVESVIMAFQEDFTRLPRGIHEFFPNLQVINWSAGNLEAITSEDLQMLPQMRLLNFHGNRIVTLHSNLFEHTPQMQYISFSNNLLQHTGLDLLTNMDNLTVAFFISNPCISTEALTREEVQELNLQLPIKCPPPPECPAECMAHFLELDEQFTSRVDALEEEVSELRRLIEQLVATTTPESARSLMGKSETANRVP